MAEYGFDVANMTAYADESLTLEVNMAEIPNDTLREIMGGEPIVRCRDCAHRPVDPNGVGHGFTLQFPDERCPCRCDDGWYSWRPPDDWFCANGELKGVKHGED